MRRNVVKRWWILILILWLGLGVRPSESASVRPNVVVVGYGNNTGDPDDPMSNPPKKPPTFSGPGRCVRTGGESRGYDRLWMWRLQAVLRALPGIYFR